jgi:predicted permease
MNGFLHDLRFGLRQLIKRPGFAAAAILTLALGIGANTAVFSVLNGYLLKSLPYPHSDRLVEVNVKLPKLAPGDRKVSLPMYDLVRKETTAFSSMALIRMSDFNLKANGEATRVVGVSATASLFQVLGITPALGHAFTRAASAPGRGHVAVISNQLWHSSFGANPAIIGRTVRLNGKAVRIIGVMPRNFTFAERNVGIWVPLSIKPSDLAPAEMFALQYRFLGRLKPHVVMSVLQQQLNAMRTHIGNVVPATDWKDMTNAGFELTAQSYRQSLLGDRASTLFLLQGAVVLVLLITCVNVANLLLSRMLGRSHEIAMRSALGATRGRLARQLLVESLWLAVPGGLAGVALGWLGLHLFAQSAWHTGESVFNVALDWRVGLFALGAACLTGILVSVLPILHLAKADLQSLLQEGGRSSSGGRGARRIRSALVVIELTFATALLASSGLLLHSFMNLEAVNPGFRKDNVLIAGLLVPKNDHSGDAALSNFYHELLQRVRALPGVEQAGIGGLAPMGNNWTIWTFQIRGRKRSPASAEPSAMINAVDGGYFKALDLSILRGRNFDARDTANSRLVVIVGAHLARKYFGDSNPIGHQIKLNEKWHTIIGVVPSIKYLRPDRKRGALNAIYTSAAQAPARGMRLVLHTSLPPNLLSQSLHNAVAGLDPSVAVYDIQTMRQRLGNRLHDKQTTMTLLLAFGGIALALAVVGVYSVLSYAVGQRRRECGIRLALGAMPSDLLWLFIKDGLRLLGVGLVAGLLLAVIFGFVLSSRLFGVAPFDPVTLAGTIVALTAVTLTACYLPARRASRLDPAIAIMENMHYTNHKKLMRSR